jgi:choline dehydrogenase-like flavoprotein
VWRDLVAAPFRHGRRRHVAGWASQLGGAAHLRLLTKANVVGFIHRSGRISAVEVALPDRTLVVHADVFVLAVGGIDNPRLLLNSRPVLAAMGDAARNVGRFFMEHLHFVPAYLEPSDPDGLTAMVELFGDHSGAAHWVTPADDVVRRHDLLRVGLAGVPIHPSSIDPAVSAFGELVRIFPFGPWSLQQRVRQAARIASGATAVASAITARMRREPRNALAIAAMGEQAPYSESSITLGPGSDRFGVPLAGLDWRIASHEIDAVRRTTELLAGEVERAGVGRVVSIWDQGLDRPDLITGGWHHMGTTRMGADPSTSVVDGDCKVHGLDNLYMGGSSVFATGGYANPTLTLVALAIRLGRHLAGS